MSDARPSSARPRPWTSVASKWVLALAIFGSALALGSVHTPVLCVVTVVLAMAAWLAWFNAEPTRPRSVASVLFYVAIGLTAYTVLQCVPMPVSMLAAIAPQNADVWARCLSPLREPGPSWAPISLDPIATRTEVLKGVAYLLAFLTALRVANRREGVDFCAAAIVITATTLGVAALLHPAFGAEKVFGVYRPEHAPYARHVAPILNPNVLAGYLNIGFCIALAAGISPRPRLPRPIAMAFAIVLAAIQLWVASRGGVLAMVVGAGLVVGMTVAARREDRGVKISYLVYGVVGAAGVVMCVLAASEEAWGELASADTSKLNLFKQVLKVVKAFPIVGTGRGAFESVYPAFRQGTGHYVFTHPENVVLQWVSEWGVVIGLAALGAVAWGLRPRAVFARGQSVIGAWAAILSVAVHNLVDLSSEIPGVVVALSVCAAIVVGGTSGAPSISRFESWGKRTRALAWGGAVCAAAAMALVVPTLGKDLYADRAELRAYALHGADKAGFHELATRAMLRHPGEPYLPFTGALRASRVRDESVLPWAERTLERAPVYGPVHLLLARSLFRSSPAQARLEYRYAILQGSEASHGVAKESAPLIANYDDAMEIVPPGKDGIEALSEFARTIGDRLPATQARLDEQLLSRAPLDADATRRRATGALRDLEHDESWCADDRKKCVQTALDGAKRLEEARPGACEGFELRARVVAADGDVEGAFAGLASAAEHVEDRSACLVALVELAKRTSNERRITAAIDQVVRAGCASAEECVGNLQYAAQAESQRGNLRRALAFYRKAYERSPEREENLAAAAGAASALGLHAEALEDYAKLAKHHPDNGAWQVATVTERAALGKSPAKP